VGNIRKR